jgi:hypothetical protein
MNLPLVPKTISGVYVHGKLSTDNLLPPNTEGTLEVSPPLPSLSTTISPLISG